MHDLSDAQIVAAFLDHVQPKGELTQAEAAETLSRLGGRKIHQTTISRWIGQGAKRLESHTRHAIERYLEGEAALPDDPPQLDEWTELTLEMVRHAGGQGQWSAEQRRLIQRDVLEGIIRLGVAEGKDVRALQDMARDMDAEGSPPSQELARPTAPRTVDVLAFYDRESRAAELRAAGMREWAVAVRLAEEETRARRLEVSSAAEAYSIAEQGVRALEIAEAGGALPLGPPPAPARPARKGSPAESATGQHDRRP